MNLDLSLYLITDRRQTRGRTLIDTVHAALDGGARAVQLREKDLLGAELLRLATELRDLTLRYGAALFVNDRIDVALAVISAIMSAEDPCRAARELLAAMGSG